MTKLFTPARQGRLVPWPSPQPAEPAPPPPDETPAPPPAAPEPEPLAEPRARIANALCQQGKGGGAEAPDTPASARDDEGDREDRPSSLPAMIAALPGDATRAPQTQFSLDLQIAFLETLAVSGSVRSAARRVGVSHMSAYRARRKCAAFRQVWDAALVLAIPHAEDELTCRAIDGVEEDVMYRGEVVHTRIRKDARLLLAHLGRLDKKAAQPQAAALAECFDDALEALGRGEGLPPASPATPAPASPSGQCNRRNTSPALEGAGGAAEAAKDLAAAAPDPLDRPCDCVGAQHDGGGGPAHWEMGPDGPEPVSNEAGGGPCCAKPRWPDCRDCVHYPPEDRMEREMEACRPEDAPNPAHMGDAWQVHECQMEAFSVGDEDWWSFGAGFEVWAKDAGGTWRPEREIAAMEEDEDEEDEYGEDEEEDEGEEDPARPEG